MSCNSAKSVELSGGKGTDWKNFQNQESTVPLFKKNTGWKCDQNPFPCSVSEINLTGNENADFFKTLPWYSSFTYC